MLFAFLSTKPLDVHQELMLSFQKSFSKEDVFLGVHSNKYFKWN